VHERCTHCTEDPSQPDIIDEAITLFRANSLFRNFEIKGAADRTLIYLILYISDCLNKIASPAARNWTPNEAVKQLTTLALENFSLPGDAGFPLNTAFQAPKSRSEADTLRQYLSQCRQEMAPRLVEKVYGEDGKPSKWWMAFQVGPLWLLLPFHAGLRANQGSSRAETAVHGQVAVWAIASVLEAPCCTAVKRLLAATVALLGLRSMRPCDDMRWVGGYNIISAQNLIYGQIERRHAVAGWRDS
jgi:actin related protein 2/3 complex subunit 3